MHSHLLLVFVHIINKFVQSSLYTRARDQANYLCITKCHTEYIGFQMFKIGNGKIALF